ncbi:DUF4168 domain-containing protein [Panacagrimonas sp.]|uniref:DUF4168 domain-containing protein n=1 Tax=Panacagrimonas sp. TaxID=2480088 RepID=UPI003B527E5D
MTSLNRYRATFAASLCAGAVIFSNAALAQGTAQPPAAQPPAAALVEVDDKQIDAFAQAQGRVTEISQKWQAQIDGTETEAEMQSVQEKARKEMVIAVQNSGLTLEQYNQIAMAAQNDAELQQRIRAAMTSG